MANDGGGTHWSADYTVSCRPWGCRALAISANGTRVPPATQIIDFDGARWQKTGQRLGTPNQIGVLKDGKRVSDSVDCLYFRDGVMYQYDAGWSRWTGSGGWIASAPAGMAAGCASPLLPGPTVGVTPEPVADTLAPAVPTGFKAVAVSPTQINLSWSPSTDNVGVDGYYIYDGNTGGTVVILKGVTSYSHTGLAPGKTYSYRVSAFDAVPNHSAWTDPPITATTPPDTTPPTVPSGLVATAISGTQVDLSWKPATDDVGVVNYQVYLDDQLISDKPGTAFSHTGLTPGSVYSYRVSAADAVPNYGPWTDPPLTVMTPLPGGSSPMFVTSFINDVPLTDGQTLSGSVVWTATPDSTRGAVTKVEFFIDDETTPRTTEMASPYQFGGDPLGRLDTTALSNGSHILRVEVTFADGMTASIFSQVTVAN